jgi:murein DD-endopeptidase MepM/ murein hydrolase activator NlpD
MAFNESLASGVNKLESQVIKLIQMMGNIKGGTGVGGGLVSGAGNLLKNSLANVATAATTANVTSGQVSGVAGGVGQVVSGFGQIAQGTGQLMPDVQATVQRAGTFYNATVRAGMGMSRGQMQQATLQGMRGGLTAPGSDANVANYLASQGVAANTAYGSHYQQITRSVGNAAKYLNMGNEQSAAAIAGLNSGQGSGNFLNRYGILTSDMETGKRKTQGQIFNELADKLSLGDATEEEVLDSIYAGNLGVELANSGMTGDQQEMFKQFMIERARGNNMDLSDPEAMQKMMDKAKKEGNENPYLPGYDLNTAKTDAMGGAEGAYLVGIKAATKALEGLAKAGGAAASIFGGFHSASSMFASDALGQGAMNIVGGIGSIVSGLGQAALGLIGLGGDNTVGNASAGGGRRGAPVGGDSSTTSNASSGGDSSSQGAFKLVHPVNPAKITARFGQKTSSYTPGKIVWPNGHKGVDYEAKAGQTVYAAAGGTVLSTSGGGELGNYVLIDHGNGYFTFYCHLTSITASGTVKTGQPVGTAGNTGTKSSGVHLHFALSKSRSTADAIDPEPFLSGTASSVPASNPDQSSSGSGDVSGSSSSSSSSVESSSAGASSSGSPLLTTGVSGYSAAPTASGSSSVEGVAPWTGGSAASGATSATSAAGTAGAGEGGDGYTGGNSDGYLSAAAGGSNAATLTQRKSRGGSAHNVTINLTIANASDDEAKRFAVMVKRTLEEDSMMNKMARA